MSFKRHSIIFFTSFFSSIWKTIQWIKCCSIVIRCHFWKFTKSKRIEKIELKSFLEDKHFLQKWIRNENHIIYWISVHTWFEVSGPSAPHSAELVLKGKMIFKRNQQKFLFTIPNCQNNNK